jgi:D-3-phosphoglycerate dehydrogenase
MPTILISTSSFASVSSEPLDLLEQAGIDCRVNPHGRRLTSSEAVSLLHDCSGVIAGTETLDKATLQSAPGLEIISRCGTGLENIDLEAAADLGIEVRNTPDALTDAVAELALGGILDLLRSMAAADRDLRRRHWHKPMGRLLKGKTVGLVGFGRIGKRLAELLRPFAVGVMAYDITPDHDFANEVGVEICPLDTLIPCADIVSLHLPFTTETRGLMDRHRLEAMRKGAILVNCSRGGLVDETVLYELLEDGRLGGAFLDTFESEPYDGPFVDLPNVLLTPHIGSYAAESRALMEIQSVQNLLEYFQKASER